MAKNCWVAGCNNSRLNSRLSFFKFPKDPIRFDLWCNNLDLDKENLGSTASVCEQHFKKTAFSNDKRTALLKSAAPYKKIKSGLIVHKVNANPTRFRTIAPRILKFSNTDNVNLTTIPGSKICHKSNERCLDVQQDLIEPPPLPVDVPQPFVNVSQPSTAVDESSVVFPNATIKLVLSPLTSLSPPTPTSRNLQRRLKHITRKYRRLKVLSRPHDLDQTLSDVFGGKSSLCELVKGQWDRMTGKRKKRFSGEEKVTAMTLRYSTTRRGYKTLMKLGLQLPSLSSLNRWIKKLHLLPGINQILLDILRERVSLMNEKERDCVIMWDEMAIKQYLLYNKYSDLIEGIEDLGENIRRLVPAKEACVVMIRGLNTNWVYPFSYYFSCDNTPTEDLRRILNLCIDAIQGIGLKIRVAVCDQSFTNQALFCRLGVSIEKPWYEYNDKKIYCIYDTPHVIKNIRNHFKKHGFFVNGKHILWKYLVEFHEKDRSSENRLAPKLTVYHIRVPNLSKMKVKLATQVFSRSVQAGMKTLINLPEEIYVLANGDVSKKTNARKMSSDAMPTANFIGQMDDIFDLCNISERQVLGKPLKSANNVFKNLHMFDIFRSWVESWQMSDGAGIPDSVRGLQLTLNGLKNLVQDLQTEHYRYVFTRKVQQDCLEHYFAFQRGRNGYCVNPTAKQFRENFRYIFVCDLLSSPVGTNCEPVEQSNLLLRNSQRFVGLLENDRYVCVPPPINATVSLPHLQSPGWSSNSDESSGEDQNDDLITDFDIIDFFELSENPELDLKDENVSVYIGNWCVKNVIFKTKCEECKRMLEYPNFDRENPGIDIDETLLYNKCWFPDSVMFARNEMTYGHILKEEYKEIFVALSFEFRNACLHYMNSKGLKIAANIILFMKRSPLICNWLINTLDVCKNHRVKMLKLYVTAKIFQLVKHKNELYKQSKSKDQTREDLRHQ